MLRFAAVAGAARPAGCGSLLAQRICRRRAAGELKVLQRVGAAPDVRLACQLRPTNNLTVTPLLPAHAQASEGYGQPAYLAGQERMIAVMFADIRSFTGIAETKLPYDLVFFLNSYFAAVGAAIVSSGGIIDKFVGDGVMALFGVESGPEEGCRQALAAAQAMIRAGRRAQRSTRRRTQRATAHRHRHSLRPGGGRAHGLRRNDSCHRYR